MKRLIKRRWSVVDDMLLYRMFITERVAVNEIATRLQRTKGAVLFRIHQRRLYRKKKLQKPKIRKTDCMPNPFSTPINIGKFNINFYRYEESI